MSRNKAFKLKLRRAYLRGARWNWVYWRAAVRSDGREILVASVPQRIIVAIEQGLMTRHQAAQILSSQGSRSLEAFTPYVPLWSEAILQLLHLRVDARRSSLLGLAAVDLYDNGKLYEAFDAAWMAAEIEKQYAGRVYKWKPLLYLLADELVRLNHERAKQDARVRSSTTTPFGTAGASDDGRGRHLCRESAA